MKLNLGCGSERLAGFVNVDKFGTPDQNCDLELTPWPWNTSSVDEIRLHHVLEHLGQSVDIYLKIIQEIYRISTHGARIEITVPHPRHDDFLIDPTHVRPILAESFQLFSRQKCIDWQRRGISNTPLALYLEVDFETEHVSHLLDASWHAQLQAGKMSSSELSVMSQQVNNVIKQTQVVLRVVKNNV